MKVNEISTNNSALLENMPRRKHDLHSSMVSSKPLLHSRGRNLNVASAFRAVLA